MHIKNARVLFVSSILLVLLHGEKTARGAPDPPRITHGIASGDVTATTAVVWARSDRDALMTVRYGPAIGKDAAHQATASSSAASHFTAQVKLHDLQAATHYRYVVWLENSDGRSTAEAGAFRTAPSPEKSAAVSVIWSGDLGGQEYCRRADGGYAIFQPMAEFAPDLFIANGDMIYGDDECPSNGPEEGWVNVPADFPAVDSPAVDWLDRGRVEEVYAAHWRYNRDDPSLQNFLRRGPMYVQWDDHEVINDFGASWTTYLPTPDRAGYETLVAAGRKTLFDFHPIDRHPDDPDRIYRSFRWGRDLELYLLDARSYRSENTKEDSRENTKTMLGANQLEWLETGLARSSATWKVVSTDVPLSAPTGSRAEELGRDSWASGPMGEFASRTGFESELLKLLRWLDRNDVRNVVFVATDVHFAAQIRYELDVDGDGDELLFHELIRGPLSAVRAPAPPAFDPTLHPVVLFAEGDIFNFGTLRIGDARSDAPRLRTDIRDETGRIRPGSELELAPER